MQFLLLQLRESDDPMRTQERVQFARSLACELSNVQPFNLLAAAPSDALLERVDAVLVGGSGIYSAAGEGVWLERACDALRTIVVRRKPMFASCWGFQALSRALGGRCIHDPDSAELGTVELHLTTAGRDDPLFGSLPEPFLGQAGHEDSVAELPAGAVALASSTRTPHQAFKLTDAPVYATQFHPELDRTALLERVAAYPHYVERIAGVSLEEFAARCRETPEANALLRRFVEMAR